MPPIATHEPNIPVAISFDAPPIAQASFSIVALGVPKSTNSLNGERYVEYTGSLAAETDEDDMYISAATLAAVRAAFSQNPAPSSLVVFNVDDATDTPAVKAEKAFATVGGGTFDTVLQAHTAGIAGNSIEVILLPDSSTTVSIEVLGSASAGYTVIIHYKPATSTVANVESAITALSGISDVIDVKTTGTGATVLASTAAAEAMLAGGAEALVAESYADGFTALSLLRDDWYAGTIDSRDADDIASVSAYIEARGDKLFIAQSSDASWLNSGVPAGFSGLTSNERTAVIYHDDDDAWADIAWAVSRLAFNPDSQSAPWDGPITVAELDSMSAAQRTALLANNANVALGYGGYNTFVDAGHSLTGRALSEVVTADWYRARIHERIASRKAGMSARGEKWPVSDIGSQLVKADADALLTQGVAANHFLAGARTFCKVDGAYKVTQGDIDAEQIRALVSAQHATGARIFSFALHLTRSST